MTPGGFCVPGGSTCPLFASEGSDHPLPLIPDGTTTFKHLSRLDTNPDDSPPSAPDLCLLQPASSATGRMASLCPRKDLHLLDSDNWFHRGSHPRIPTVTDLTRHETRMLAGVGGAPEQSGPRSRSLVRRSPEITPRPQPRRLSRVAATKRDHRRLLVL